MPNPVRLMAARPDVRTYAASTSAATTSAQPDDDVRHWRTVCFCNPHPHPQRPPPGCARYSIEVARPIGLVLEEQDGGAIVVAEIVQDGNAAKTGLVGVGDQLIATSGVTYTTEQRYQVR